MLVLGRKIGTAIEVSGPARLTILGVDRGIVRVGVEAERSVDIVRSELVERRDERKEKP